jgi:hypothetical protein
VWEINQKIASTPSVILPLDESEGSVPNRLTRETLKRSDPMKSDGWFNVHQVNNSRDSFSPELRRNRWGKHQGSSGLNKVTMLMLSNTILSMSIDAWVLRKSALLRKKVTKRMR